MPTGSQPVDSGSKPHADGMATAAHLLGDRWTMLIVRECFYGTRRFGDMARNLGIARKVLTTRLKDLVAMGILERRLYHTEPDWYEYILTPAGRDLYGAILALLHWADVHHPELGEHVRLHHMPCDHDTHAVVVCAHCREELDPREVEARLPR
ncbi:winged helix-turn-helix transcriptional regulator [Nocardia sp. NPDC052566]|uniref:winged helix-turn-helix transcriptional regulator n=1 Tax=Nocardia sp. NPDC052566 TaxID=3364330 RepID=UPI0037C929EE